MDQEHECEPVGWMETRKCDPPTCRLVPAGGPLQELRQDFAKVTLYYYEAPDDPHGTEYCKSVYDDGRVEWVEHFYVG